jgi:hypothetical protein
MNNSLHLTVITLLLFLAADSAGFGQPVITTQPQSQTNVVGTTATFWVAATNSEPLAYRWQKFVAANWSDLTDRTNATLVLTNVQTSDTGDYRVAVTDATGTTNSDVARLTVMVPPVITRIVNNNPLVGVGATVKMQVWVGGTTPSIQWRQNGLPLSGKTSSILTLSNVQTNDSGLYTVVVTNYVGSVTSSPISLEVTSSPQIQYTPSLQHNAVDLGKTNSLTVSAFGTPPFSYQWRRDGGDLLGETHSTLLISGAQPADEGDYSVVVTNAFGKATSDPARLWVVPTASAFIKGNFTNNLGRLPYFYMLPTNYDPARTYPLVCFFHGLPGDETMITNVVPGVGAGYGHYPALKLFASGRQQVADPVIMLWPCRRAGDSEWTDQYLRLSSGLLDQFIAQLGVDTNRLYLDAGSGGLNAAWDFLALRRGDFAAARLLAGWPGVSAASAIKDAPIWAFCAADDGLVGDTRNLVRSLRTAGGNPLYTEYVSGGHLDTFTGFGAMSVFYCTPTSVNWLLAHRRGAASTNEPLLSITNPTQQAVLLTGATNLNLAGTAAALDREVTQVAWTNFANNAKGVASGTNVWSVANIPLVANKTNVVVVVGTTTSWAPAFGGNTTFVDTLTVIQSSIQATLALQGREAILNWTGGGPPYRVQRATDFNVGDWTDFLPNATPPVTLPLNGQAGFYRIVGQ